MSVSYCFMKVGTEEKVPLNLIDDEVRKMMGKEPDMNKICVEFECLAMLGIASTFSGGPSTKEGVEAQITKMRVAYEEKHPDQLNEFREDDPVLQMYRRFLYQEYVFDSWR